jgi:hypothetical protein
MNVAASMGRKDHVESQTKGNTVNQAAKAEVLFSSVNKYK